MCRPQLSVFVRIETLPLIIGVLVALLGIGIMMDAWTTDTVAPQERRRRARVERHRNGEALIGLGVLALAAAFIGRDSWRYSTLVVILGALSLVIGTVLNRRYVHDLFVNRGPLRRREEGEGAGAREPEPTVEPAGAAPTDRDVDRLVPGSATNLSVGWPAAERRKTPRDGNRPRQQPGAGSAEDPPTPNH